MPSPIAGRRWLRVPVVGLTLASVLVVAGAAAAADMTVRQVTEAFFTARAGSRPDLSGKDLKLLDLSGLDFKAARIAGADLFGVDLTDANLSGVDLSGVRLDRAIVMRTDFSGANLSKVTLLRPAVYSSLAFDRREAPSFARANLSGARIMARLDGADFREADLTGANFGRQEARGDITILPRSVLMGCDFSGARLRGADLHGSLLAFSKFVGADLPGTDLSGADLSRADLRGADLTGANLTGADLDGADFTGARGLDQAKGLASAVNLDRARR